MKNGNTKTLREWSKTNKHSVHNLVLHPESVYQFSAVTTHSKLGGLKQRSTCWVLKWTLQVCSWGISGIALILEDPKGVYSFAFSDSWKSVIFLASWPFIHLQSKQYYAAISSSSTSKPLSSSQGEQPLGDLLALFRFIQIIQSNLRSPYSLACISLLPCKVICSHTPKRRAWASWGPIILHEWKKLKSYLGGGIVIWLSEHIFSFPSQMSSMVTASLGLLDANWISIDSQDHLLYWPRYFMNSHSLFWFRIINIRNRWGEILQSLS